MARPWQPDLIAAVREDLTTLLKQFQAAGSLRLDSFLNVWQSFGAEGLTFGSIHLTRPPWLDRKSFDITLFRTVGRALLLGPGIYERVGCIYTLYCLWCSQPLKPRTPIRLTPTHLAAMRATHDAVDRPGLPKKVADTGDVLQALWARGALCLSMYPHEPSLEGVAYASRAVGERPIVVPKVAGDALAAPLTDVMRATKYLDAPERADGGSSDDSSADEDIVDDDGDAPMARSATARARRYATELLGGVTAAHTEYEAARARVAAAAGVRGATPPSAGTQHLLGDELLDRLRACVVEVAKTCRYDAPEIKPMRKAHAKAPAPKAAPAAEPQLAGTIATSVGALMRAATAAAGGAGSNAGTGGEAAAKKKHKKRKKRRRGDEGDAEVEAALAADRELMSNLMSMAGTADAE